MSQRGVTIAKLVAKSNWAKPLKHWVLEVQNIDNWTMKQPWNFLNNFMELVILESQPKNSKRD